MLIEKKITELKPHPMNELLFDDIEGQKWEEFLESVQRQGVMTPLMIMEDGTIISGHQRWRACHALGIPSVKCIVYEPKSDHPDDDVLLAIIESNIRQRGVVNSPTIKLGRMIAELERIYGVDQHDRGPVNNGQVTKTAIREHLGVDRKVATCAKAIAKMPEEMQTFVEQESITPRTAYDIVCRLTPEQQVELAMKLDPVQKYTQSQIREAINRFFPKAAEIDEMQAKLAEYQQNDGELELRERLRTAQAKERKAFEDLQAEKRAHKKTAADCEKRMDAMERLLDEQGCDAAPEIRQLTEERDQYMHDAEVAQSDADIELVCSMTSAVMAAFSEIANDPRPLSGQRAGTAALMVRNLQERLAQIQARLSAGDPEIQDAVS